jgi:hypothetical protein
MKRRRDQIGIFAPLQKLRKIRSRRNKAKRRRRRVKPPSTKDSLTPLPKDLKLKLISFLTRSETLRLARCSRFLKRELTSEEVWKAFIKRMSPSLLALPMRAVNNWRDKFKVFLQEPVRKNDNKVLRLHFILKVDGVVHSATLSNPRMDQDDEEDELMRFFSGQDFDTHIPYDRVLQGTLMLLLTYDGMTSVLLPESSLLNNLDFLVHDKLSLMFLDQMFGHLTVWVSIHFKWSLSGLADSSDEDVETEDGSDDLLGVESVAFNVSRDVDVFGEEIETLDMDTLIAERLKWY